MNRQKLLQVITVLVVTMLFPSACHPPQPAFTPAPSPALVSSPAATLTSVPTPTPTPVPTATPAPGIGVPVTGNRWQVTVEGARRATQLTVGLFLDETTYTAKAGYTFLVVDFRFSSLDPIPQVGIPTRDISVVGASEKTSSVYGIGGLLPDYYACVECSGTLRPILSHHLAFIVKEDDIDQPWELLVEKVPPIPFSVGGREQHTFTTEIGNWPGALPSLCRVEPNSWSRVGPLIYKSWGETGLTLAGMVPDGSQAAPICAGVASAELKRAPDGGALLLVGSKQGWQNLYVVEPDGKTLVLAKNSPGIEAQFDPTGRYIFFTTSKIGIKEQEELYVFDRRTTLTTLLKNGKWVNCRLLANGRLVVNVKPVDRDSEFYWSQAEGLTLERLNLPSDTYLSDIADDGVHIIKAKSEGSNYLLTVSKLDGSAPQKLVTAKYWPSGKLSPNGRFILISIPQGGEGSRKKAELRSLVGADRWIVVQDGESFRFDFSADSRWALVYIDAKGKPSALHIVSTADGRVVHKIEKVINAIFSPDSTQLAYTVSQNDGSPAMYVSSLESQATQSLGAGVLREWLPTSLTP